MVETRAMTQKDARTARLQVRNGNKIDALHTSRPRHSAAKTNDKIIDSRITKRRASIKHRHDDRVAFVEHRLLVAERQLAATTRRLLNEIRMKKEVQRKLDDSTRLNSDADRKDATIKRLKASNSKLLSCLAMATVASIWDHWGSAGGFSYAAGSLAVPAVEGLFERVFRY